MFRPVLLVIAALFSAAEWASANSIYDVTVNTSSISGDAGSLDFQFNPGPLVTEPATLQILDFTTDGTLDAPAFPTGDVTGTLPGTLSFDTLTVFNDYFEDFTFGSKLSFDVTISGTAGGTSGSAFAFSMFSDQAGAVPVLTSDPNGIAFLENLNTDGTTTPTEVSPEVVATSPVPEPRTLLLLCASFAVIGRKVLSRQDKEGSAHRVAERALSEASQCVLPHIEAVKQRLDLSGQAADVWLLENCVRRARRFCDGKCSQSKISPPQPGVVQDHCAVVLASRDDLDDTAGEGYWHVVSSRLRVWVQSWLNLAF
jgi:hypothetical protein